MLYAQLFQRASEHAGHKVRATVSLDNLWQAEHRKESEEFSQHHLGGDLPQRDSLWETSSSTHYG